MSRLNNFVPHDDRPAIPAPLNRLQYGRLKNAGSVGTKGAGIRHRLLEWCGLVAPCLAMFCLVGWIVSIFSQAADLGLAFRNAFLRTTSDEIIVTNNLQDSWIGMGSTAWGLPGFRYQYLTLTNGNLIWSLNLSLLIPATLLFEVGVLCIWRCRIGPRLSRGE